MSSGVTRESPLVRFARDARATGTAAEPGVISAERAFLGHINLRGDCGDPGFVAAVASVVGMDVPIAPNTVAREHDNTAYWLGPNEWLIVTPGAREAAIARDLRAALAGRFAAVTEVSGGQTIISLRGVSVRDLLAKGCPLDLHPRVFGVARCAQSHLAKAPILVHQVDETPSFDIIVRRSFTDYLWLWLEDAAAEYGHRTDVSTSTVRIRDIG
jgi:sarcosine oxidase subunit gamma